MAVRVKKTLLILIRSESKSLRTEHLLECAPQRDVDFGHADEMTELDQAGHPKTGVGHTARHDCGKMRQVRFDIDGDAMQRDPALQPYPDRGDLVLEAGALVRPTDPDADAILAPLAANVEAGKRADDPFLECCDVSANVGPSPLQIEHDISDPLAGA